VLAPGAVVVDKHQFDGTHPHDPVKRKVSTACRGQMDKNFCGKPRNKALVAVDQSLAAQEVAELRRKSKQTILVRAVVGQEDPPLLHPGHSTA